MLLDLPQRVEIYEVGPRDGLQNESAFVPTEEKVRLIGALVSAGLRRIEITSFVHPRWVPQLADADQVARLLGEQSAGEGVVFTALVPNRRGLDRALEVGVAEVAVFMSASETHNQRNVNKTVEQTLQAFLPVFSRCAEAGVAVRAYLSTVWGCPYEGPVEIERSAKLSERLLEMGAYQVSLGDTIGVGTPVQTRQILEVVLARVPAAQIALHMHDTRGTALANCLVGLELGVTTFDASVGGMGGCPYAPGATGNLATGELVYMLDGMGVQTGVELAGLVEAGRLASALVGRTLPSRTLAALGQCEEGEQA